MSDWKSRAEPVNDWRANAEPVPVTLGSSPDNPKPAELYKDNTSRFKAGFSDIESVAQLLKYRPVEVKRNKDNEIVAKDPNGNWYRDDSQFLKHPLNWLESAAGGAPSTVGMVGGGILGSRAGLPGALGGAAAGSAAGELARQTIGKWLGVHGAVSPSDIAEEAVAGGVGELGGRAMGVAAKNFARSGVGSVLKSAAAGVSSKMSGVPKETVSRMLDRPDQVMHPPAAIDVAPAMAEELMATQEAKTGTLRAATKNYDATVGQDVHDTRPLMAQSQESLAHAAPSPETGVGLLEPKEYRALNRLEKRVLTSKVMSHSPLPDALESKLIYEPSQMDLFHPGVPTPEPVSFSPLQYAAPPARSYLERQYLNAPTPRSVVAPPVQFSPYSGATPMKPISVPRLEGHQNIMPEQTGTNLRKAMQGMGSEIERNFDPENQLPSRRSGAYIGYLKDMYGRMREVVQGADPAFAKEAANFHEYALDSKLLKPVTNPNTQENFIKRLGKGEGVSNHLEASSRQTPIAHQDILDMNASHSYDNSSPKVLPGGSLTHRQLMMGAGLIGGTTAGAAVGGDGKSSAEGAAVAAMLAGALSPSVHKRAAYYATKAAIPVIKNSAAAATKMLTDKFSPYTRD